jgi:PAS domain S-box-containing protein
MPSVSGVRVWEFMAASLVTGETVFENDLVADPPVHDETRDFLLDQGIRAFVAVPFEGERQAGLIGFASSDATEWDVDRLALLRIGAEMISNVLERRVAENVLRLSSERLRQMADNVHTLFWVCKAENQEPVYASKGLGEIFGIAVGETSEQASKIRLDRMIHEDDFQIVVDGFLRGTQQRTTYEYRVRRPDGEVRWLRTRCFPVPDPMGAAGYVAGVTDDISEEKQAVEELAYHGRFEHLISQLAMGFIDVPVGDIDESIDGALRLVGEFAGVDIAYFAILDSDHHTLRDVYDWTSALGAPYRKRIGDISLADYPWTYEQLLRGDRMYVAGIDDIPQSATEEREVAELVHFQTAVTYPMMNKGELVAVLGFISLGVAKHWSEEMLAIVEVVVTMFANVLERRRAEHELARRVEFERLIGHLAMDLVNLPDAQLDAGLEGALRELAAFTGFHTVSIFQLDPGGRTISCTHEWASRPNADNWAALQKLSLADLAWTANKLLERNVIQVVHIDDLPEDAQAERALLEQLGVRLSVRVGLFGSMGPRGFLGFATTSDKPDLSEDLFPLLRIAAELITNALERRRAERAVSEHQAELAHALRLGTMGELAPWLAHELNQPLSAISSFARGCQRRLASGDVDVAELTEVTEQMTRQAMRAGEVVQSLRRYVRKHEPRREWHQMNDLVSSALSLLQVEAVERGIDIETRLDSQPAWVQVDPIQTEQVVLNLVRNGFDAIDGEGSKGKSVIVSTRCTEGFVEVSVADTGVGFASGAAEELFEAFRSTKSSGLGLGLSISRSIVEAHGGRIRADSALGEGATFTFSVPRRKDVRDDAGQ